MKTDIISAMRFVAMLAILPAVAFGVTVETLPAPTFADTEVSTNVPFAVSFDTMSRVNFSLSLDASPSNSVEVSIGEDANADGNLSPEEAAYTFGFDCGCWFKRCAADDSETVEIDNRGQPTSVQAYQPGWVSFGVAPLNAGGIGLEMNVVILPLDVSFAGVAVEEVPSTMGVQSGYFLHPYFNNERCHSRETGAGIWFEINRENNVTTARDCAALTRSLPRMTADMQITSDPTVGWIAGENIWSVPFGWHQAGTTGDADPYKAFAAETTQIFTIDPTGTTSVRKLGNEASREISGHVFLNGERVW